MKTRKAKIEKINKQLLESMLVNGCTPRQIGEQIGYDISSVYSLLKKYKLSPVKNKKKIRESEYYRTGSLPLNYKHLGYINIGNIIGSER